MLNNGIVAKDLESAQRVLQAAQTVGGEAAQKVVEHVESDQAVSQKLTQYQQALQKEQEVFNYLLSGKYSEAITAFEAAEDAYNGFHQVYEISRALKETNFDDPNQRKGLFRRIVEEFSLKAPKDALNQLRELSQE